MENGLILAQKVAHMQNDQYFAYKNVQKWTILDQKHNRKG